MSVSSGCQEQKDDSRVGIADRAKIEAALCRHTKRSAARAIFTAAHPIIRAPEISRAAAVAHFPRKQLTSACSQHARVNFDENSSMDPLSIPPPSSQPAPC
jgi:hypothetical protein